MRGIFVAFCILVLCAVSLCQEESSVYASSAYEDEYEFLYPEREETEREEPYIEFNSFEGSYSSNFLYSTTGLFLCVDRHNQLSGSYDDIGILQGFVENTLGSDDIIESTATGNFYEAGTGTCVTGTFEMRLTSWGFNATFSCEDSDVAFAFEEVRTNSFRPSDEQCALLDRVSPLAMEGSWENSKGFPLDVCLTDTLAKMSYVRRADDARFGEPFIEGYVEGVNFLFGKVVAGTWYEEDNAGPILFFIRNNGELHAYRWSGLLGNLGRTVIDPTQYRQEEKHQNFVWSSYLGETTGSECGRFAEIEEYVLDNLPQDDDDAYYFVNEDYFDEAIEPRYYLDESSSSASIICASAMLALLALI